MDGSPDCQTLQSLPELRPHLGAVWFSFSIPDDGFGVIYGKKAQLAIDDKRVLIAGASHPIVIDLLAGTICKYGGLKSGAYRVSSMVGTGNGTRFVASFGSKSSAEQKIAVFAYDRQNGHAASLPPVPKLEEATWGRMLAIKQPGAKENLLLSTHGENTSMNVSADCGLSWTRAEQGKVSNFYEFDTGRESKTLWFVSGPIPDQSPFVMRKAIDHLGDGKEGRPQDCRSGAMIRSPHSPRIHTKTTHCTLLRQIEWVGWSSTQKLNGSKAQSIGVPKVIRQCARSISSGLI